MIFIIIGIICLASDEFELGIVFCVLGLLLGI